MREQIFGPRPPLIYLSPTRLVPPAVRTHHGRRINSARASTTALRQSLCRHDSWGADPGKLSEAGSLQIPPLGLARQRNQTAPDQITCPDVGNCLRLGSALDLKFDWVCGCRTSAILDNPCHTTDPRTRGHGSLEHMRSPPK